MSELELLQALHATEKVAEYTKTPKPLTDDK